MANILDLRRFDLRTNVLENPFWITSAEITAACDAKVAGLFSFPISAIANTLCEAFYGNTKIIIQEAVLEINTAFSGGTPALIMGTHVLDLQTTLAYTDSLDPNAFVEAIDGSGVTNSAGLYPLHATSAFNTARVAGQHAAGHRMDRGGQGYRRALEGYGGAEVGRAVQATVVQGGANVGGGGGGHEAGPVDDGDAHA